MSRETGWAHRAARASAAVPWRARMWALALIIAVAALAGAAAGCGDDSAPDITVAALGAAVGEAKLDDVDFSALIATYTSEDYSSAAQPEQSNYQLYLAAKAADLGLNQPDAGKVVVSTEVDGASATFRFVFAKKEGLFAVADVGSVDISLVRTDAADYPWRIGAIALAR